MTTAEQTTVENPTKQNQWIGLTDYFYALASVNNQTNSVSKLIFYPNPAINVLNVNMGQTSGMATLSLSDVAGRLVMTHQLSMNAGQNAQMDISALPSGIYMLNSFINGQNYTARVIKQ